MLSTLTDRSTGQEDKRRLILDAAVRVFARKGYHTSRVGDIAEEAGVAHGLLYHYFRSKEELLETIFRETWRDVLDAIRTVEETDETARDRLAGIAKILLRAWRRDPDLVRVLVREVTRSSHLQRRVVEIDAAFTGLSGPVHSAWRSRSRPRRPTCRRSCTGSPTRERSSASCSGRKVSSRSRCRPSSGRGATPSTRRSAAGARSCSPRSARW